MTITLSQKMFAAVILTLVFVVPGFAHAEETTTAKLQTQYQVLMERFEKMKSERNSSSTASTTKRDKASTTVDRTCMAAAVATREASIATAWSEFAATITKALTDRSTEVAAAWNSSESGSRDGVKQAWDAWKATKKSAHSELRTDRKAAWETFKKTAKDSCKVTTPKEESLEKESKDSIAL